MGSNFSPAREPAIGLIAVIAPAVALLVSLYGGALGPDVQTGINAAAVALAGFITAALVNGDRLVPALLGLGQALVTLAVAAGLDLDPSEQAGVITVMGILVAAFVRQNVDAPVDELGQRRAARARHVEHGATAA